MAQRGGKDGADRARIRKEAEPAAGHEATDLHEESRNESEGHGLEPVDPASIQVAKNAQPILLQDAILEARAARADFYNLKRQLSEEVERAVAGREPWQDELRVQESDIERRRGELADETARLKSLAEAAEQRERANAEFSATLRTESAGLARREADAATEWARLIGREKETLDTIRQAGEQHRRELDDLAAGFAQRLAEQASAAETEHGTGLTEWSARLAAQQGEQAKQQRQLDHSAQELKAQTDAIEATIQERLPGAIQEIKDEVARLRAEIAVASAARESADARADESARKAELLEVQVQDLQHDWALFERLGTDNAIETIRVQRAKIREQEEELNVRPTADTTTRMGEMLIANQRLHNELATARRELEDRERRLHELDMAVASEQQLSAEVDTFKTLNETYLLNNAELRKTLKGDRSTTSRCFPRLAALDKTLKGDPTQNPDAPPLKELAASLRAALATETMDNPALHYDEHDVRAFIAGLAMSRLHILEGDAGTGKTSLAVRAAELLGGEVAKIDVQAGWRDATRLTGTYNTFERRFEEEPFTVAVYKAGAERYSDQIFVVVLDEMNLSSIEAYLADLSPKLEDAARTRQPIKLDLMTNSPEDPKEFWPARLFEGRVLTVPENVWFIGTANRDESTHTIAEKTYDRAAILQLERVAKRPEAGSYATSGAVPVGLKSLRTRFEEAKDNDAPVSETKIVKAVLRDVELSLATFSLRWSPRFERQLDDFVPVYCVCGGKVDEAIDHLLATKALRRLRDRYGNRKSELEAFKEELQVAWGAFDVDRPPTRSMNVVDAAIGRAMA